MISFLSSSNSWFNKLIILFKSFLYSLIPFFEFLSSYWKIFLFVLSRVLLSFNYIFPKEVILLIISVFFFFSSYNYYFIVLSWFLASKIFFFEETSFSYNSIFKDCNFLVGFKVSRILRSITSPNFRWKFSFNSS